MSIAMSAESQDEYGNYAAQSPKPPRPGRLRQEGLDDIERNFSVFMHLSPLIIGIIGAGPFAFVAPLVLWLVRKDKSVFNDDHGREVLNFLISILILTILLPLTIIGIIFVPVLWIVGIVNLIRGAIAAGNGEYFRYPLTFRFLT